MESTPVAQIEFAYKMFLGYQDKSDEFMEYLETRSKMADYKFKYPTGTIYMYLLFHVVYEENYLDLVYKTRTGKHYIFPLRKNRVKNKWTRSITWIR